MANDVKDYSKNIESLSRAQLLSLRDLADADIQRKARELQEAINHRAAIRQALKSQG